MPRARHCRREAWGCTHRERSAPKLLGAPPWLDDVVGAFGLPSPLMSATAESATTYFCFLPLRPSREVSLGPEVMDAARLTEPQAEHMVRVVATILIDKRPALKGRCVVSVGLGCIVPSALPSACAPPMHLLGTSGSSDPCRFLSLELPTLSSSGIARGCACR